MATIDVGTLQAILRLKDELTPQIQKTSRGLPALGNAFKAMAATATVALAAVGVGLALFAKRSVQMAVQAQESENLFAVSFGNMAEAAREWSNDVSAALGLNAFEVRKQAATLFVMSESMGVSSEAAFEMSTQLTVLAGDMASFFDLPVEEAFLKIQSGISGESEPLKRLGIIVNETTIKHTALQAGLIRTGQTMDEATKVQARYLTIMDQTVKAQGDLARTIDSPANAMRILSSQFDQFQISIGQAFVPALQGVVKAFSFLLRQLIMNEDAIKAFITRGILLMADALVVGVFAIDEMVQWYVRLGKAASLSSLGIRLFVGALIMQKEQAAAIFTDDTMAAAQKRFADSTAQMIEDTRQSIEEFDALGKSSGKVATTLTDLIGVFKETAKAAGDEATGGARRLAKAQEEVANSAELAAAAEKKFSSSLDLALKAVADLDSELSGFVSKPLGLVEVFESFEKDMPDLFRGALAEANRIAKTEAPKIGGSFSDGFGASMKALPGIIVGALQGGGDLFKAIGAQIGADLGSELGKSVTAAIGGQLGKILGSLAGPLGALAGSALGGLIDSIFGPGEVEKVNDLRDAFFEAQGGFVAVQQALVALTDQDLVKQIFDAQTVEEFDAAVSKVMGLLDTQAVAQQALADATERYGFTIEELGPAMQRQELDAMAGQLLQDFELLKASGIDVGLILEKMGTNLTDFVNTSIAAGQAVPEAMRPMIEAAIANGEILDANGEAYASAEEAGITFAQSLEQGMMDVVEQIKLLVAALTGIPAVTIPVHFDPDPFPDFPGGGSPNFPDEFRHGSSGFRDFGAGTPAILHGVERVQTPSQAAAEGGGSGQAAVVAELRALRDDLPFALQQAVRNGMTFSR